MRNDKQAKIIHIAFKVISLNFINWYRISILIHLNFGAKSPKWSFGKYITSFGGIVVNLSHKCPEL